MPGHLGLAQFPPCGTYRGQWPCCTFLSPGWELLGLSQTLVKADPEGRAPLARETH